jgi:hypothetical protein
VLCCNSSRVVENTTGAVPNWAAPFVSKRRATKPVSRSYVARSELQQIPRFAFMSWSIHRIRREGRTRSRSLGVSEQCLRTLAALEKSAIPSWQAAPSVDLLQFRKGLNDDVRNLARILGCRIRPTICSNSRRRCQRRSRHPHSLIAGHVRLSK